MMSRRSRSRAMRNGYQWGPRGRRQGPSALLGSIIALVILGAGITLGTSPAAALTPRAPGRAHRILIVSVPTLSWTDLDGGDAPNLSRFLDSAAIADLATRADRQPAKLGAAYVTIGAGTRA